MHQMVKNYLQKQEDEKAKKSLQEKSRILLALGLYEKEYSENSEYSDQYPESEWDHQTNSLKYFRKIPVEVDDDDFREIMKYQPRTTLIEKKSTIAVVFKVIAWIVLIGGFIAGFACGNVEVIKQGIYDTYTTTEFSFVLALTYWAISFISGMFCFGFAEIIQLLTDLKNR